MFAAQAGTAGAAGGFGACGIAGAAGGRGNETAGMAEGTAEGIAGVKGQSEAEAGAEGPGADPPRPWMICVNSPGPDDDGGSGAAVVASPDRTGSNTAVAPRSAESPRGFAGGNGGVGTGFTGAGAAGLEPAKMSAIGSAGGGACAGPPGRAAKM